ncbi:MAG: C25 family cysteine peptidase, partial [Thermoplasmatota archaeon]
MKKIAALLIVALFAGGGLLAGLSHEATHRASSPVTADSSETLSHTFSFPAPEITREGWLQVNVEGCTALQYEGAPMLPYTSEAMTFPLGTRIQEVQATVGDVETRHVTAKVAPASRAMSANMQHTEYIQEEGSIYESGDVYPADWVQWRTGAGLHNGEHVTFLTLQAFPARYAPQDNILYSVDRIEVTVTYEEPSQPLLIADAYDLLVIAPQEFTDALQPLVQHKEDHGLATQLVTLDEIYASAQGRDDAERVKYYIKDAL